MVNEIYNIDIESLMHHPANPRTDIGDITELTESIKAQGVMQNLTIIPVHYFTEGWSRSYEPELLKLVDNYRQGKEIPKEKKLLFYVLIGNRRLEASKAAGLTKLPCKIVTGLTEEEQIGIMLTENMQRSDLTIQEEAVGFQQMLDYGADMKELSEISGLSETTVRHRVNIAKLDQELVTKAIDNQINLTDFIELEKISDIDKRNEILKNSSDIKWSVKKALENQEKEKRRNEILSAIRKDFLIEEIPDGVQTWDGTWEQIVCFDYGEEIDTSLLPEEELFYRKQWSGIAIWHRVEKKEKPEDAKKAKRRKVEEELREKAGQIKEDLSNYIEHVIDEEKKNRSAVDGLWTYILENNLDIDCPMDTLTAWIQNIDDIEDDDMSEDEFETILREKAEEMPLEYQLLILIYDTMAWNSIICTWRDDLRDKEGCKRYGAFIDLIESLYSGEVISEELQTVLDGSHKLFEEVAG